MRGELEPILATAVKVESVKHPAISADVRSRFKHKLLASSDIGPSGPAGTGGSPPAAPTGGPRKNGRFFIGMRVQSVVNVVVIISIVLALVVGGMIVLPVRTPLVQLVGEIANHRYILEGFMKNSDPEGTAKAINENPQFLSEIIAALPPDVIAEAINNNPESSVKMMGMLNPKAVAVPINENGKVFADIVAHLPVLVYGDSHRLGVQHPHHLNTALRVIVNGLCDDIGKQRRDYLGQELGVLVYRLGGSLGV